MPQSERANVLKDILRWLVVQEKGVTLQALSHQIKWEITEGGATDTTIKKYIQDLESAKLIEFEPSSLACHELWKTLVGAALHLTSNCPSANTDIHMKIGYRNHPISQCTQTDKLASSAQNRVSWRRSPNA